MSEPSRATDRDMGTVADRRPVTLFAPPAAPGRELMGRAWRGTPTVFGTASILIGVVPLLAGVAMLGVATGSIAEEIATLRVPRWIAVLVALVFLLAGLFFVLHGWRGISRLRRVRRLRASHPDEPWLWEHPWNAFASFDETRGELRRGIPAAIMLAAFLLPFNWLAFSAESGHWVVALVTGAFDAILLLTVARLVYLGLRVGRYGTTELRLPRFPCHTGSEIELKLVRTPELAALGPLRGTLRCIEERAELRGPAGRRRRQVVAYALHESMVTGEITRDGDAIVFRFPVPDDAAGSALAGRPPRYWELAVEGDAPGVDYGASFLVPIYARRA